MGNCASSSSINNPHQIMVKSSKDLPLSEQDGKHNNQTQAVEKPEVKKNATIPQETPSTTETVEKQVAEKEITDSQIDKETVDTLIIKLLEDFHTYIVFFHAAENSQEWANETGRKYAANLNIHYGRYKKVKLTVKRKKVIVDMFIEKSIPACFNRIFSLALTDYPEIFSKDEKVLKSEKNSLKSELNSLYVQETKESATQDEEPGTGHAKTTENLLQQKEKDSENLETTEKPQEKEVNNKNENPSENILQQKEVEGENSKTAENLLQEKGVNSDNAKTTDKLHEKEVKNENENPTENLLQEKGLESGNIKTTEHILLEEDRLKAENLQQKISLIDVQLNAQNLIGSLLCLFLNCSDGFPDFALACGKAGIITSLLDYVVQFYPLLEEKEKKILTSVQIRQNDRTRIFNYTLGILHNTSKFAENREYFEKKNGVDILLPYLQCEISLFSMKALLVLAYLIGETNNHLIMANQEPIKLMIGFLRRAVLDPRHRHIGFSVAELCQGLSLIAQNDSNKKTIGENDGIGVFSHAFDPTLELPLNEEELLEGCKALWILAFDENNREIILHNKTIMTKLQQLKDSGNPDLQKTASGVLWEVLGKHEHTVNKEQQAASSGDGSSGHIMISYQWDHQETVIKIRDRLAKAGYKVWMDVDQMGGSTLEAMANAVEGASAIIVTVCHSYKDSPNCRSEAEYAFQLKRKIIPLMMEHDYKPDGWLGFIVGAKFWIDFKDHFKLENSLEKLLVEMHKSLAVQEMVQVDQVDAVGAAPPPVVTQTNSRRSVVLSWKNDQVQEWLTNLNLYSVLDYKVRDSLDGNTLLRLQSLRRESPEFFYSSIRQDLKITHLFDILKFVDELEKLLSD